MSGLAALSALVCAAPAGAAEAAVLAGAAEAAGPTVVATGLDNPHGLAWAANGTLLVAEAGRGGEGPCFEGPEGEVRFGLSGAVTNVTEGGQTRIVTGLPSLAANDGSGATGAHDIAVDGGTTYVITGLGADPAGRAGLGAAAGSLAGLHRLDGGGQPQLVADLGAHEASDDPDFGQPDALVDTNPFGLLAVYGQQFIADAGANAIVYRGADGTVSTLVTLPFESVDAPPFLGAPPGTKIPMQPVPTAITLGPDGALYIAQLTGFPFPVGGAKIFRWTAGVGLEVAHSGFTNISDIAFGPDGELYVLEIAKASLLAADQGGRLTRIDRGGTRTVIGEEGLLFPTSVLVGADGVYVSNCGVCPGRGEVWRY
jgi:hypothetical protein